MRGGRILGAVIDGLKGNTSGVKGREKRFLVIVLCVNDDIERGRHCRFFCDQLRSKALNSLQNKIALHTWTLDTTDLAQVLAVANPAGYNAMELRHVDFMRARQSGLSEDGIVDLIERSGMVVGVIGTESGALFESGDTLARLMDSLHYVCQKAMRLKCSLIMLSPGQQGTGGMQRAQKNLKLCAHICADYGLRLCVEFNSRHPIFRNLTDGVTLVDQVNEPNCGLLVDTYHLHSSGGPISALEQVPIEKIIHVQFSDVPLGPASDSRMPVDRLPPGHGAVAFVPIFTALMKMGYNGWLSYEAPNPMQWSREPSVVAEEGIRLVRALLDTSAHELGLNR